MVIGRLPSETYSNFNQESPFVVKFELLNFLEGVPRSLTPTLSRRVKRIP